MEVTVHPFVPVDDQPSSRLRLWVGVFGADRAPALRWEVDGRPADPVALRPLRGVRAGLEGVPRGTLQAFTGVYELDRGVAPRSVHTVRAHASADGASAWSLPVRVRALPDAVPSRAGESFNVLLVSCFHQHEDRTGEAGRVVAQLPGPYRPDLTLLMGDQVYLDLPLSPRPMASTRWLADKFEGDYRRNWQGTDRYRPVLHAAPNACIPDDHEYWNNAPHPATVIPLSYTRTGRERMTAAAGAMYDAFQLAQGDDPVDPGSVEEARRYNRVIDIPPLSFFLMDNRTSRQRDLSRSLHPRGLEVFDAWAKRVRQERRTAVIVTGQSLFQEPASRLRGAVADRHLANYGDYPEIMARIAGLVAAGCGVLCLTGDVHYGRVTEITIGSSTGNPLYEVIASPSSLVSSPQSSGLALRRLLSGEIDLWPRHREAQPPPEVLVPVPGGPKWSLRQAKGVKGNHVGMLSFRERGPRVEVTVDYWMTLQRGRHTVGPLRLGPRR